MVLQAEGRDRYLRVASSLQEMIEAGELSPGQRIPATAILAARFGVSVPTMQKSLTRLVRHGYIRRTRRKGTEVIYGGRFAGQAAIVFGYNPLTDESCYNRLLLEQLRRTAAAHGVPLKFYMDIDEANYGQTIRELEEDIRRGEIGCVVPVSSCRMLADWLQEGIGAQVVPLPEWDWQASARDGMEHLLGLGHRRIAFVTIQTQGLLPAEHDGLRAAIRKQGLREKDVTLSLYPGGIRSRDGYERMREILSVPRRLRPDAVFSHHDVMTCGALQALADGRVRIPADLALLTHANKGGDFLSRVPLTRVEFAPQDMAARLVSLLAAKQAGRPVDAGWATPIQPRLVEGESCGETRSRRAACNTTAAAAAM